MQRSARTFSISLSAAVLALGFNSFAVAKGSADASDDDVPRTVINFADLNLASPNDAKRLYMRIERAAYNLCHVSFGPSARALQVQRECAQKAIDGAIESVDNSNLTAVSVARSGKRSVLASSR